MTTTSRIRRQIPIPNVKVGPSVSPSGPTTDEQRRDRELQYFVQNIAETLNENAVEHDQFFVASGSGDTNAPTNAPVPTGITVVQNLDGSQNTTLTWDPYVQGAITADVIVVVWKTGTAPLSAPTTADKAITLLATATYFTFQGLNPADNFRFGIAVARKPNAASAYIAGAVQSPTAAPDFADISSTSLLNGTPTTTVVANAADGEISFLGTVNYRSAGAPTNNITPTGFTSVTNTDGSRDLVFLFDYTQGAKKADHFLCFVKQADATPVLSDPHFEMAVNQ